MRAVVLCLVLAGAACGGEVVVLEPLSESGDTSCAVQRGEDVCERDLGPIEGEARRAIQAASTFALLGTRLRDDVERTCARLVADPEPPVTTSGGAPPSSLADRCAPAVRHIAARRTELRLEIVHGACEAPPAEALPACLQATRPVRRVCAVSVREGGAEVEDLTMALRDIHRMRSDLEDASAVAGLLATHSAALREERASCASRASELSVEGLTSLEGLPAVLADLASAFGDDAFRAPGP